MSKVFEICIADKSGSGMIRIPSVDAVAKKGIINDRYFNDNNEPDIQITLIESENIDYLNEKLKTNIPYIDFRRDIITKGIKLNELVGKKLLIGEVIMKGHRLCDPCKYLQDKLKQTNSFNTLAYLHKRGGLRCELITGGKISINDEIKII